MAREMEMRDGGETDGREREKVEREVVKSDGGESDGVVFLGYWNALRSQVKELFRPEFAASSGPFRFTCRNKIFLQSHLSVFSYSSVILAFLSAASLFGGKLLGSFYV